jgi:hypothetical protein
VWEETEIKGLANRIRIATLPLRHRSVLGPACAECGRCKTPSGIVVGVIVIAVNQSNWRASTILVSPPLLNETLQRGSGPFSVLSNLRKTCTSDLWPIGSVRRIEHNPVVNQTSILVGSFISAVGVARTCRTYPPLTAYRDQFSVCVTVSGSPLRIATMSWARVERSNDRVCSWRQPREIPARTRFPNGSSPDNRAE